MEHETGNTDLKLGLFHRLSPALIPALLIGIGYVDPGKWVATVEGGARFGADLVLIMLVFNLAAILCQYMSARIGVVTGRDLAQICSDEYDKVTCLFLGVQAELSVILLDLTMILGVAHALNLLFGVDLSTCVFLSAIDVFLFPLFSTLLENHMKKFLSICIVGLIWFSYVLGILVSQREIPLSMNGMLTKLSGDSAFALMSLLGANIIPHNFYLHSSIAQKRRESPTVSKDSLCLDHLFSILSIFSAIYLVNYVLMNSAANLFYSPDSSGFVLLTFHDTMSLLEQVFRSPLAPLAFFLILFFSNQFTALTWNIGGQVVLHDFLRLDIPGWLHRATIRIIAAAPALYCVWTSGAEGIYQLLVFTQIVTAMLLPSSVIPLFRVASSRPIMGVYKNSQFIEFLALITFMGMVGTKMMFVLEMIFGQSDWVGNLRWSTSNSVSVPFVLLLIIACWSFVLTLWLAATPLKSATAGLDAQLWSWENQNQVPEHSMLKEENRFGTVAGWREEVQEALEEPLPAPGKSLESRTNFDLELPETLEDSREEIQLTTIDENISSSSFPDPPVHHHEEVLSTKEVVPKSDIVSEVTDGDVPETKTVKFEALDPVEKTVGVEGDVLIEKDDDEADTWEPEESTKCVSGSTSSLMTDGPSSLRSLSGKGDEGGNGSASLSRLAGLGRAARRQLAAILDEFWGQLYDFHGQATADAKANRLDVLLGVESKVVSSSMKVDTSAKEFGGYFPTGGGKGSESLTNSTLYDSPRQQRMQTSIEVSYGAQRGPSILRPNQMQLLDSYVKNPNHSVQDAGERRYSSLRVPPSSEGWDYQPATVHGYQLASYRNSDYLKSQMESQAPKSPSLGPSSYRDPFAIALGQKLQNGITPAQASAYQSLAISRNSSLQSERLNYSVGSTATVDTSTKKYHSLPDISGLAVPQRSLSMYAKTAQWDGPTGYGSVNMSTYGSSLYSTLGARAGSPLAFDEHPASKAYRNTLPGHYGANADTGSLWSRQPFEQFGLADKVNGGGHEGPGSRSNSLTQEAVSNLDPEAKLLQSFRYCIVKLLKLEGSEWLFRQNDGVDEDLIDRVAAREKFLYEAETREMNNVTNMAGQQYLASERKFGSSLKNDEGGITSLLISSVPHCGEGCIWKTDLMVSFGVWCIHRVLDLSLMESRPELWGKYTYVLNRLQGVIDPAFSKPRSPPPPCFCVQIPASYQQQRSSPPSNGILPPTSKPGRGKCTTAAVLLELIKDVEIAISCRKGRTGTAAGDVAFPKGKENLASVLKRYKRRLANKPVSASHDASGQRKVQPPPGFGL